MDFEHTDCDEAEAVDFTRPAADSSSPAHAPFSLGRKHYRAVRKVRDDAHGKAARTVSDGLTP